MIRASHAAFAALAILLQGCAAARVQDDWQEAPGHPPLPWRHVEVPQRDLAGACRAAPGAQIYGCAHRIFEARLCLIYTGPSPAAWVMEHERKHCAGWDHGPVPETSGSHVAAATPAN